MIKLKGIVAEDFINYKKPSLFLATHKCDFKCCLEQNLPISTCQNSELGLAKTIEIEIDKLVDFYIENSITKAIVVGGMEPMISFEEVFELLKKIRNKGIDDDFVIYTGYYPEEMVEEVQMLKQYKNVYIKFGRYIPNSQARYDEILGVTLASSNQYCKKIS